MQHSVFEIDLFLLKKMAIAKCSTKLMLKTVLDTTKVVDIRVWQCAKKCVVTSIDALDNFTDKLIEEKSTKWKKRNIKLKEKRSIGVNRNWSQKSAEVTKSVDSVLVRAIYSKQSEHTISLLNTCQLKNEYPSPKILLEAASFFGRKGNKKGLEIVQQLCQHSDKDEFNNQAQYMHYMAEATWKNGNIEVALNIFAEVYHNHSFLRRKIRTMTRFLFSECILHKSEASLVLIKNFSLMLAEKYGDLFFLICLWQYCFVSEWFSDQQLAAELFKENEKLRKGIKEKAPYLALEALKDHRENDVQRILEFLLLYDMKQQYAQVLRALFDYKCYQGDVKGCFAILESTLQLNILVNFGEQMQFLYLLASDRERLKLKELEKQFKHRSIDVPQFNLKF